MRGFSPSEFLSPILVLLLLLGSAQCNIPCVWNITSDFLASPQQVNPNPDSCGHQNVWFFTDGAPPPGSMIPNYQVNFRDFIGIQTWGDSRDQSDFLPWIGQNTLLTSTVFGTATVPPKGIFMHPGPRRVILSWRCPETGAYAIQGGLAHLDICGDGVNWELRVAGTQVNSGIIPQRGTAQFNTGGVPLDNLQITVDQLVSVYVGSGSGSQFVCDPTGVELVISTSTATTTTAATTTHASTSIAATTLSASTSLAAAASLIATSSLTVAASEADVAASTSTAAAAFLASTTNAQASAVSSSSSSASSSSPSSSAQTSPTSAVVAATSSTSTFSPEHEELVIMGTVSMPSDWTPPPLVVFVGNGSSVVVNGVATLGGTTAIIEALPPVEDDNVATTRQTLVRATGGIVGKFASVQVRGTRKNKQAHCFRYDAMSQDNQGASLTVLVVPRPEACKSSPSMWLYVGVALGIIGLMVVFGAIMWYARDALLKPDISELYEDEY